MLNRALRLASIRTPDRGQPHRAISLALEEVKVTWQGILAGVTTPFDPQDKFDRVGHGRNIEHMIQGGVHGLIVLAVMGEGPSLSHAETLEVAAATVEVVDGRVPVLGTVGGPNERLTMQLIPELEDLGVDGLLVIPPWFYPLTTGELVAHLGRVSARTSLPLMLYNSTYSHVPLVAEILERLVLEIPNFVALKEGNQLQASEVVRRFGERLAVFTARDIYIQELLAVGGAGATSFTATLVPEFAVSVYEASKRGDWATARRLQDQLNPLTWLLVARSFPAGIKAALDLLGLAGGAPRPPLMPFSDADLPALHSALQALGAFSNSPAIGLPA
jgi:4-hydroxy-tetrahydrodipicolinate synthase